MTTNRFRSIECQERVTSAQGWDDLMRHVERIDLLLQRHFHERINRVWSGDALLPMDAVEARLAHPSGIPAWQETEHSVSRRTYRESLPEMAPNSPLAQLSSRFMLNGFERDVLVLGLLPHLDGRYHTLLSIMQGKGQQVPTVELALRMLCSSDSDERDARKSLFPMAPLFRHHLIQAVSSAEGPRDGWGRTPIVTAPEVWHFLLGDRYQSRALDAFCRWAQDAESAAAGQDPRLLGELVRHAVRDDGEPSLIVLRNAREPDVVHALAQLGHDAAMLDLTRLPRDQEVSLQLCRHALRDIRLHGCAAVLNDLDDLVDGDPSFAEAIGRCFADAHVPLIGRIDRYAPGVRVPGLAQVTFDVPDPTAHERALALEEVADNAQIDALGLSRRFFFSVADLAEIKDEVALYQQRRAPEGEIAQCDWVEALRHRARQNFGNLAQRVVPRRTFGDLIVSNELRTQLEEILAAVRHREELLELGFAEKVQYGTGISALFHGPSGTGKTMAAEVLAESLSTDLIKVDLSAVVNKYIGETEKNLARIFDLAQADAGVLFFDEADALFGKRSQVKDAHDRHANIEVSYLLQRLEAFSGLVILATNNRGHVDEAFIRRFTFAPRFAFPDSALREKMWRAIWPEQLVVEDDVDFAELARVVDVTGANIRNIALLAGWMARSEGCRAIQTGHIERASAREMAKVGRLKI